MNSPLVLWADNGEAPDQDSKSETVARSHTSPRSALNESTVRVLEQLRLQAGLSRINIFRLDGGDPPWKAIPFYDSHQPAKPTRESNGALIERAFSSLGTWADRLAGGITIGGSIRDFDADEQWILENAGVEFLLIAPLILFDDLWGIATFEAKRDTIEDGKRATATLCSWIVRGELLKDLARAPFGGSSFDAEAHDRDDTHRLRSELSCTDQIDDMLLETSKLLSTPSLDVHDSVLRIITRTMRSPLGFVLRITDRSIQDGTILGRESGAKFILSPHGVLKELHTVLQVDGGISASGVAFPLVTSNGEIVGLIAIVLTRTSKQRSLRDIRALSIVAESLAGNIQSARTERALAESEQRWQHVVDRHPDPLLLIRKNRLVYANRSAVRLLGAPDVEAIEGRPFYDFLSAEDFGLFEENVLRTTDDADVREHDLITIDGDYRTVRSSCMTVKHQGANALLLVLNDITDSRNSARKKESLLEVITGGLFEVEFPRPLDVSMFPAFQRQHLMTTGTISYYNKAVLDILHLDEGAVAGGADLFGGILGVMGISVVDSLINSTYDLRNHLLTLDVEGIQKVLLINSKGHIIRGMLRSVWFSFTDITDLLDSNRRMVNALESQQNQIGRDLHDDVGQLLTGVRILSQNLVERFDSNDVDRTLPQKMANMADMAAMNMKSIYSELVPEFLYHQPFKDVIGSFVSTVNELGRIKCQMSCRGDLDKLNNYTKLNIYRIIKECVNNALKHSKANNLLVSLKFQNSELVVFVEDDGVGIGGSVSKDTQLGLGSMRYRARSIGGELLITAPEGGGTKIACIVSGEQAFAREA